jgi:hypothetical protein
MVKVAFIVEGDVEKIIVEECLIKTGWLKSKNIEPITPVINARGGGNLCPHNIPTYIEQAQISNPDKIIILTDLECDPCIEKTKERLGDCDNCITIISRKSFEAWFLADDTLLSKMTNGNYTHYDDPELTTNMPYDDFRALVVEYIGRGTGSKVQTAIKVSKNNFNIENAASHPNCSSAKYFVDKIEELGGVT